MDEMPIAARVGLRRPSVASKSGCAGPAEVAIAITVHVTPMLAVMAVVALVVYEKLGVTFLPFP